MIVSSDAAYSPAFVCGGRPVRLPSTGPLSASSYQAERGKVSMLPIETERLVIRPLSSADVAALVVLWTDPEVTRYMGGPRDPSRLESGFAEDLAAAEPPRFDLWPTVETASGQVIGHCGLLDKEVDGAAEIEVVYVLARSAWGKGFATEAAAALCQAAFGRLNLPRLIALIDPRNVASARVAEKIGLRLEKTTVRPGGKVMQVYALSAAEAASRTG
jgi:[ribosomal protein S5]-alanine N-acetyltransferase